MEQAVIGRFAVCALAAVLVGTAQGEILSTRMLKRLAEGDSNKDGAVTRTEFADYRRAQFPRMDRDGDGYVTQRDIDRIKMFMPREIEPEKFISQFDADKDKRMSREELANGPAPLFDFADTDRDGVVSAAEYKAAAAKLKKAEKK
jgi:Ca2+-binding EF-hand superfamily protein